MDYQNMGIKCGGVMVEFSHFNSPISSIFNLQFDLFVLDPYSLILKIHIKIKISLDPSFEPVYRAIIHV